MKKYLLIVLAAAFIAITTAESIQAIPLLNGFGGDRDYGELAMGRNDDGSSNQLPLPFDVNFFGNTHDSFFVNNNGNVTFDGRVGSYTPVPFPVAGQPMIAPYWADVDTRANPGDNSNNVWIASPNPETVVVTWDMVGYYGSHLDKRNDFQLVMRDRSDTGMGNFDVDFRYNQLQWTTGDASGGSGGLGGTPAQAGYDSGEGMGGRFFVLPYSFTSQVLLLQDTSNVSSMQPGLWSFAIRNGELPGRSPSNPLMPVETAEGWDFEFGVELNQTFFIDPEVAVGYDYLINSGPLFQSVLLPDVGDGLFDLYLWDMMTSTYLFEDVLTQGLEYDFGPGGVDQFRILGIEESAGLDPNDPLAFVTGLTFTDTGIVNMSMNPLTVDVDGNGTVPEPGTMLLIGSGLLGLGVLRRRMK